MSASFFEGQTFHMQQCVFGNAVDNVMQLEFRIFVVWRCFRPPWMKIFVVKLTSKIFNVWEFFIGRLL
jgi:hypothetical protein